MLTYLLTYFSALLFCWLARLAGFLRRSHDPTAETQPTAAALAARAAESGADKIAPKNVTVVRIWSPEGGAYYLTQVGK